MADRELMQQAFEALEDMMEEFRGYDLPYGSKAYAKAKDARLDLYARLAKPEQQPAQQQEPVATDWERVARVQDAKLRAMCDEPGGFEKLCEVMDRYEHTSPPAQRKPLTMQERTSIVRANTSFHDKKEIDAYGIIDDVEAAHDIKENT